MIHLFIFNKDANQDNSMSKEQLFWQKVQRQQDSHIQKYENKTPLQTIFKY